MRKNNVSFKNSSKLNKSSGFTLLELLVVIFIIGLVSSSFFAIFSRFNRTQNLNIAFENMKNDLNLAKSSALAHSLRNCKSTEAINREFLGYRFYYDGASESYRIEEDCNPRIASDADRIWKNEELPTGVNLNEGSGYILFKPLGGGTENITGNFIDLTIQTDNGSRIIRVYKSGVIEGRQP